MVELHREGSAPAACTAGMFLMNHIFFSTKILYYINIQTDYNT